MIFHIYIAYHFHKDHVRHTLKLKIKLCLPKKYRRRWIFSIYGQVQKSTSAKLGVRFCGSQRYSVSKNNFEKLDKYVGRSATEREFRELLANFFFNCGFFRSDIVVKVIDEIRKIRQKLQSLDGYRFLLQQIQLK